ncbi:MAG: hypothetical protein LBN00_11120 [Oscillospiraceae bacterium]|jgi:hypothetical protein|nr:hypothetical protein [Oscillospiraceae bacterium]
MQKFLKRLSIAVYVLGCAVIVFLILYSFFGSQTIINPNHMLPTSYREAAAFWLGFGTLPMLAAAQMLLIFALNYPDCGKEHIRLITNIPTFICLLYIPIYGQLTMSGLI